MNYWLIYNGMKLGPMSLEQVRAMRINPDTPTWRTGLPDWDIAANFPELIDYLSTSAAAAPAPPAIPTAEEAMEEERLAEAEEIAENAEREEQEDACPQEGDGCPQEVGYTGVEPNICAEPAAPQPFYEEPVEAPKPIPRSHLVWSIIATLLCCIPAGVVAIIYSSKVEPSYRRGDYAGAEKASENAMMWIIAAVVFGVVAAPLQLAFSLL